MKQQAWHNKISNTAQLGGIETSVLDNGAGRGTRIAWINTGSGLRFKVVIDRAMDIADAFYNEHSLAWLSHSGISTPQALSDKGIDWLRTFGGGLVVTCGLSHVGGPEKDEYGERGIHGQISNIPAEIASVVQPDILSGNMEMSISGIIRESQALGNRLELRRTISATLGKSTIRIQDEVINRGNAEAPHMLLYHCNFGYPLVDEGTSIKWSGNWTPREGNPDKIFKNGNDFHTCPAPLNDHSGSGEEVAFIDIESNESGFCNCGLENKKIGLSLNLRFRKKQLPCLTNWLHFGKGEYVVGLEPGTNPPIGQSRARQQNELILLSPGESRKYELEIEVLNIK
ncbi:MAG: aldose 1-epimerase family protein [Daejeonella sp.]|uniref:aldose 1-epimerase family protein n=1 Tax=Daejeonella sp. TaxID=2805397 RepID=UPI002732F911|nr:aldose 1-epimerase family protein [Daejeonella sp.]MDP3467919.1 aldose 1-epimerase family protein [Daejeonella sp.]